MLCLQQLLWDIITPAPGCYNRDKVNQYFFTTGYGTIGNLKQVITPKRPVGLKRTLVICMTCQVQNLRISNGCRSTLQVLSLDPDAIYE
jgi:hypothetical protein